MKRKILYVTGSRAEYGIMKRLLQALRDDPEIDFTLVATGMHCDARYGNTWQVIEQDGFVIEQRIDIGIDNTDNAAVLKSMATCQMAFGAYFADRKFDAVVLLGDRYEIFAVAIAAAMHNLPIVHLHGGEKTLGNYDEFIRHAITKMSRLHLVSTEVYRDRVIQLGEHPDTVFNVGALGAENSLLLDLPAKSELEGKFGSLRKDYLVVVFHPETLSDQPVELQFSELLAALGIFSTEYEYVFIGSNSDTGAYVIKEMTDTFCETYGSRYMTSVTPEEYLALIKNSCGLVGNSSSGLIEVPGLKVPTINIGDRQKGRVRGCSVIDVVCKQDDIREALSSLKNEDFQARVRTAVNPYYMADVKINALKIIKAFVNNEQARSVAKDFYDLPC